MNKNGSSALPDRWYGLDLNWHPEVRAAVEKVVTWYNSEQGALVLAGGLGSSTELKMKTKRPTRIWPRIDGGGGRMICAAVARIRVVHLGGKQLPRSISISSTQYKMRGI